MRAVNLLPQKERRSPGLAGAKTPLAVVGAVAILGGIGFWGYSLHGQVDDVKSDVATATAQRDGLREQLGAFEAAPPRRRSARAPWWAWSPGASTGSGSSAT